MVLKEILVWEVVLSSCANLIVPSYGDYSEEERDYYAALKKVGKMDDSLEKKREEMEKERGEGGEGDSGMDEEEEGEGIIGMEEVEEDEEDGDGNPFNTRRRGEFHYDADVFGGDELSSLYDPDSFGGVGNLGEEIALDSEDPWIRYLWSIDSEFDLSCFDRREDDLLDVAIKKSDNIRKIKEKLKLDSSCLVILV